MAPRTIRRGRKRTSKLRGGQRHEAKIQHEIAILRATIKLHSAIKLTGNGRDALPKPL